MDRVVLNFSLDGASLALRSWIWNSDIFPLTVESFVTTDCAPVMIVYKWANAAVSSTHYFNIQPFISDPSVFTLPDYCKNIDESVEPSSTWAGKHVGGKYFN